jgi:hypothetical protein
MAALTARELKLKSVFDIARQVGYNLDPTKLWIEVFMKKILIMAFIGLFSTAAAWAGSLQDFQGDYVKVSGEAIGAGPVKCPPSVRVVAVGDTELDTQSNQKDFDDQFSFGDIGAGYVNCSNNGNPFADECYRTQLRRSTITLDEAEVTKIFHRQTISRSWSVEKDGDQIVFGFKNPGGGYQQVEGQCVYRPISSR